MRRKAKIALISLLVLLTSFLVFIVVLCIDGPPPDDAHLFLEESPLAPEDNGFERLLEAVVVLEWPEDDAWLREHLDDEPTEDGRVRSLLERNDEALALLDAAVDAPHFRPRQRDPTEASGFVVPYVELGHFGQLAALRSESQLIDGDFTGAFEGLLRYLELGRRFQRSGEITAYFMGTTLEVGAVDHIQRLSSVSDSGGLAGVARRLGEHGWEREALESTLKREYRLIARMLDEAGEDSNDWTGRYVLQPNRTRRLLAKSYAVAIDELGEDCSSTPPQAARWKWWYVRPNFGGHMMHSVTTQNLFKFIAQRCGDQMRHRMTRLALALRAYRAETGGLPERLEALIPDYLDSIPPDLDGEPFRYSTRREILYSVGEDRLDEGGGEPTFRIDSAAPDPGVSLARASSFLTGE